MVSMQHEKTIGRSLPDARGALTAIMSDVSNMLERVETKETYLNRQFEKLGRASDADALAMHLLMRSQGVATLSAAYRDAAFVEREVTSMCAWLSAITEPGASAPSFTQQH